MRAFSVTGRNDLDTKLFLLVDVHLLVEMMPILLLFVLLLLCNLCMCHQRKSRNGVSLQIRLLNKKRVEIFINVENKQHLKLFCESLSTCERLKKTSFETCSDHFPFSYILHMFICIVTRNLCCIFQSCNQMLNTRTVILSKLPDFPQYLI